MVEEKAEDILSVSSFNSICRMCLVSGAPKPLFLSKDEESASVLEFLKHSVSVEVSPEDGLPEYICKMCASEVLRLQGFIKKCQEADKRLRLAKAAIADNDLNEISVCEIALSNCEEPINVVPVKVEVKAKKKNRLRTMYPCKVCAKEFNKYALCNHIRSHTKEKPFICQICKRGFSLSTNLKRHIMTHTGERPYVCNICEKAFIQLTSLVAHLKTHSKDRENEKGDIAPKEVQQYSCIHCGRSFLRLSCYNTHLLQHQTPTDIKKDEVQHPPIKIVYKSLQEHLCEICMRVYKTKWHLKQHMVTHGEKCFLCCECGKGFFTKYSLESHFRVSFKNGKINHFSLSSLISFFM